MRGSGKYLRGSGKYLKIVGKSGEMWGKKYIIPCFSPHTPLFSQPLFSLRVFFTLKQHNTTPMLYDGLCGFKIKNVQSLEPSILASWRLDPEKISHNQFLILQIIYSSIFWLSGPFAMFLGHQGQLQTAVYMSPLTCMQVNFKP